MTEHDKQESDDNEEEFQITAEQFQAVLYSIARIAARLLREQPFEITVVDSGREIEFGVSKDVYFLAVHMKKAISNLFRTMSDSLLYVDNRTPLLLVTESGEIEEKIMDAIRARYFVNMNFPELSVLLGEALKEEILSGDVRTDQWQLVNGEGKRVYLQAVGEKPQPVRLFPQRVKAKVAFFGRDTSAAKQDKGTV